MLVYYNKFTDYVISRDLASRQFCLFLVLNLFIRILAIGFVSKFGKDYISLECEINLRIVEGFQINQLDAD